VLLTWIVWPLVYLSSETMLRMMVSTSRRCSIEGLLAAAGLGRGPFLDLRVRPARVGDRRVGALAAPQAREHYLKWPSHSARIAAEGTVKGTGV